MFIAPCTLPFPSLEFPPAEVSTRLVRYRILAVAKLGPSHFDSTSMMRHRHGGEIVVGISVLWCGCHVEIHVFHACVHRLHELWAEGPICSPSVIAIGRPKTIPIFLSGYMSFPRILMNESASRFQHLTIRGYKIAQVVQRKLQRSVYRLP
jgi:hypothetical protein